MSNYLILILIISFAVLLMKAKKEHFSILACPLNRYQIERTPTEYIFDSSRRIVSIPKKVSSEHFIGNASTVPRQIWMYYLSEKNSRNWLDWGSRLNCQPSTQLFDQCVANLRKKTGWTVIILNQHNLSKYVDIPAGLEENELFIQSVIMHLYGGLWLPAYSFPIKNVDNLRSLVPSKGAVMPQIPNLNQTMPAMSVPGLKLWEQMVHYILKNPTPHNDYSDYKYLSDLTAACVGVRIVDGRVFGMLDKNSRMITFLNLVSDSCTDLSEDAYFVCINRIEEERLISQYVNTRAWYNSLLK